MVTRFALFLVFLSLLLAACSSGSDTADVTVSPNQEEATRAPANPPAGPRAIIEPNSGPPGTEVTVRGSGWEPGVLIDVTGDLPAGSSAAPYETVVSNADGSFTASFRLENTPDGSALSTGRYNLIARSTGGQVAIPFLVETRRPVGNSGPSG
jgi:hypothetical protein